MDSQLVSTLLTKLLPLLATIAAVLLIARWRSIPLGTGLGLQWPAATVALAWLVAWVAWSAAGEWLGNALGFDQPDRWPPYAPALFWLRVATIGVVGPAAEELVWRGLAFDRLRRTRLRVVGTVVVCAAAWSLSHVQYEWALVAMIFADGLFLGAVRARTGSVLLPFAMHASGNLFSIWQSTHG